MSRPNRRDLAAATTRASRRMRLKRARRLSPLQADNVVVIGASLMELSFGNATTGAAELKASLAALGTTLGYSGQIVGRGVYGANLDDIIDESRAVVEEFAGERNFYVCHAGGNNVSSNRPYDGSEDATFLPKLTTLHDMLSGTRSAVAFANLSKRLYITSPTVAAGDDASEANGSAPYNAAIYEPFIAANQPRWSESGTAWIDFYGFSKRHELSYTTPADGVHPHLGSYVSTQQFFLARMAARARGLSLTSRAGKAFRFALINTYPLYDTPTNWIRMAAQGSATQGRAVAAMFRDLDGEPDHFIEFSATGFLGFNTLGAGSASFARLADSRLHDATMMGRSVFWDATTPTVTLRFAGLHPGDTGVLTLAASRSVADAIRKADYTVSGVTKTLDAATNAASNQQTWNFTVPENGILDVTAVRTGGTGTGYLSGGIIEFT